MNRDKLIEFVKGWHGDQKRKYTNEPYFNHLLSVANAAEKTGVDYGFEIGLCHDLFEDTNCTKYELAEALESCGYFGFAISTIIDCVVELTDVYVGEKWGLNRKRRKELEAVRLHGISYESQMVKCCDLIDNTQSIVEHDPGFAVKYLAEKREILKGFTKIDGAIKNQVWNCLLDAEEKLKTTV